MGNDFGGGMIQRFEKHYMPEPNSGCWIWISSLDGAGYARFSMNLKNQKAATFIYEFYKGPVPDGLELDHLCRVRCCVNPDHLEAVTHYENVQRGAAGKHESSKTHCPQGHEYNEENTYRQKGRRRCRLCRRIARAKKRRVVP